MRKVLLTAVAALLATAAPAAAAPEVGLDVREAADVRLGQPSPISGTATDAGAPLAGREVRLEVRRHPFKGGWTQRGSATTDAQGRFSFSPRLDRNHRVRARLVGRPPTPGDPYSLPEGDTLSRARKVFVLPAFTLRFTQQSSNRVRITQTYTVPKDVRLRAPTRFYVGPCELERGRCTSTRAPLAAVADTERVRRGRYEASASVRIPASFDGRFRYVSCFEYSKGSGMGKPNLRCPRKFARLDG